LNNEFAIGSGKIGALSSKLRYALWYPYGKLNDDMADIAV
jgi:hypothetical protein